MLENIDTKDSINNNIHEKWENNNQLIEKDDGTETFKNVWYNEECKFSKEEMKKATEKWLIKGRAGVSP